MGWSDDGFGLGDLEIVGDEPVGKKGEGEVALEKKRGDKVGDSDTLEKGDAADLGIDGTGLDIEGFRSTLDK